jgi:HEAT repeat protein
MKKISIFTLLVILSLFGAGIAGAEVIDNSLGRALTGIFPELRQGYIDLNHNDSLDRLDDMDELVPDSRVKDGIIQVQEIMDFITENYPFFLMEELEAVKGALEEAEGTIPELIGLNYRRTILELIDKKEELGIDGLYLSPSARRKAMAEMNALIGTMVGAYKNESSRDERTFNEARDKLFTMIEQGYPIPEDLIEEDKNILVSALIQTALNERSTNRVRTKYAIKTLGKLEDPFAVDYILELMNEEEYRTECIRALGEIGNDEAEENLMALLETAEEEDVRIALYRALGRIGGERSREILTSRLEAEGTEDGPSDAESFAILQAISRLAQNGNTDRSINTILTSSLSSADGERRIIAAKGLAAYPSQANLNLLVNALRNEKEEMVKIELVKAVNIAGNAQIVTLYTSMLREENISDPLHRTLLEEIGKNPEGARAVTVIQSSLASRSDEIRTAAGEAFERLYEYNPKAVAGTLARAVMTSDDEYLLAEASAVLAELADPTSAAALAGLLKSPYPEVKQNATWALYKMGNTGNTRMIGDLRRLITSETEPMSVRINSVRTLGILGTVNDDIVQTLTTVVKMRGEKYGMLRYFAVRALGSLGSSSLGEAEGETAELLARIAASEKNTLIKTAALDAIRGIGNSSEGVVSTLEGLFKRSEDPEVRTLVLETLGDLGSAQAGELAESLAFDALLPGQKQRIVYALAQSGSEKGYTRIIEYSLDGDVSELATAILRDTPKRTLEPVVDKRIRTETNEEILSLLRDLQAGFDTAF